jgi:four helix bundle protein
VADYRKLEVWSLGRELVVRAYKLAAYLPDSEKFNLISQIQRAVVSIPANIAEGAGRASDAEMLRFTRTALGSLNELETLVLLCGDVGYEFGEELEQFEVATKHLAVKLRNFESSLANAVNKARYVREESSPYEIDSN